MGLSVQQIDCQLFVTGQDEVGTAFRRDISSLLILGDDLGRLIKPIIDDLRLKRPSTIKNTLCHLQALGEAMSALGVKSLPAKESGWQVLVRDIHHFIITRPDSEEGGWGKLDEMRKSYLAAGKGMPSKSATNSSRTANLKSKLEAAEEALKTERRYRIRLQVAYEALLVRMKTSATNDPDLAHFINRHVTGFSFKRLSVTSTEGKGTDE